MRSLSGLHEEIRSLAAGCDAVVLAHNYQNPEVQDVADYVGDSLGLSRRAAATDASVIVFAGVRFMAETAKILSPDKLVLMPEPDAGCPMADMLTGDQLAEWREEYPGASVVTYVNSSAEAKALSDVCCTSANAVEVVRSLGSKRVLFGPDRNLAAWVAAQLPRVEIVAWDGWCPAHDEVTPDQVLEAIERHSDAEILVHPECRPEVTVLADAVLSTSQMLRHAASSAAEEIIVVTEVGLLHGLAKAAPSKRFVHVIPAMLCRDMKITTIEKVRDSLTSLKTPMDVEPEVASAALGAVERMIALG